MCLRRNEFSILIIHQYMFRNFKSFRVFKILGSNPVPRLKRPKLHDRIDFFIVFLVSWSSLGLLVQVEMLV